MRVRTRILKQVTAVAGKAGPPMRDRSRSAQRTVWAMARARRNKTEQGRRKMKTAYLPLWEIARRVTGPAQQFSREIAARVQRGHLSVLHQAKTQMG